METVQRHEGAASYFQFCSNQAILQEREKENRLSVFIKFPIYTLPLLPNPAGRAEGNKHKKPNRNTDMPYEQ